MRNQRTKSKKGLWDNPIEHLACLIPVKDMGTAEINKQCLYQSEVHGLLVRLFFVANKLFNQRKRRPLQREIK